MHTVNGLSRMRIMKSTEIREHCNCMHIAQIPKSRQTSVYTLQKKIKNLPTDQISHPRQGNSSSK